MPSVDREGLREALAEAAFRYAHAYPEKVCWAEALRIASHTPDGVVAVAVKVARANADALLAGLLADLLAQADAAAQAVAERDEAQREHTDMMWQRRRADERAEAAQAEVARLSAEVEALRIEAAENLASQRYWSGEAARAAEALSVVRAEAQALRTVLANLVNSEAGDMNTMHPDLARRHARTALARTAGQDKTENGKSTDLTPQKDRADG